MHIILLYELWDINICEVGGHGFITWIFYIFYVNIRLFSDNMKTAENSSIFMVYVLMDMFGKNHIQIY